MPSAGFNGIEVNRAVTSYELRLPQVVMLPCSTKSWMLWMWCGDLPIRGLKILVSTLATP